MRYLTVEEVIIINEEATGNPHGLRDQNLLKSAVGRPQQSAFGDDAYPTISGKAAALAHSLSQNQPFNDGNKRTATLAIKMFMQLNGRDVNVNVMEFRDLLVAIAKHERGFDDLVVWLDENIQPEEQE